MKLWFQNTKDLEKNLVCFGQTSVHMRAKSALAQTLRRKGRFGRIEQDDAARRGWRRMDFIENR